ncbi:MAG: hypothetical protein IKU25_08295 [Clostridia bacterium]|nr:hypothetical protein [Clostridia bacterium]
MFDYAILQIVFALFLMSIPLGFATAIGWCDPNEHRRRPVLVTVSVIFTALGIFELIKLVGICREHLTPGENFLNSATGLFKAIYEITVDGDMVRFADDQIHALVFSGVAIVFTITSFIVALFFTYVLTFRIALLVDKALKNVARYAVMAACIILVVLFGVITSQYLVMTLAIVYIILSAAFLIFGNWRLARSGDETVDEVEEIINTTRKTKEKKTQEPTDEDMEQEAQEFFGNTGTFKF